MISKKQEIMSNALEVRHTLSKELPMGYKRTEVGVIPEDWNIMQLADVCIRQGIVRGPFGGSLKKETFATSGFKVYEQRNAIYKSCEVGSYFIDQSKYAEMHRFSVSPGDFIISCSGTIGRIFQIPCEAPKGVINQALLKLSTDQKVVYDLYFYILFEWDDFQMRIIDSTQGGAMKNLVGMDVFRTTPVVLPSLSEQRAIAEALSDVDGLLAALEALIAKKRAIKQAAMQQLLTGKTRLPRFRGKWETRRLEEMVDCLDHVRIPLNETQRASMPGPYPYCGANGVLDYVNDFILDDDVILIAEDGGYFDEYAYRPIAYRMSGKIWVNNHAHILKAKLGFNQGYLYFSLVHKNILPYLASGTRAKLNKSELNKIEIHLPFHNAEQKAIAAILSDMDTEIAALEKRRDKTRAIKQGMMQQLLTGRIRLVQPETTTEELAVARPVGRKHNWQFNEAVVISVLAKHFGNEQYPLGRMRYTKLSYLLHRHEEGHAEGYLKKAAGPYNPHTRYGGPEKIALEKDYMRQHRSGKGQGFIASTHVDEAERYFDRWYGSEVLQWLEQFRYETNNDLELLTTVDMAAEELCEAGEEVSVESIKEVIRSHPEWNPKLDRPIFSDASLARAIESCQKLFDY